VIDVSRWKDARAAALRAHRTQHQSVDRYFFNRPDLDRILGVEIYRQAWGPPLRRRPAPNVWD
jgi:LmbE family N-acetylglucosaminyl deacetylase